VYFDRHTLSIKAGQVSMYTLDGRMRFQLTLRPQDEESFHKRKLFEIILKGVAESYVLDFRFGETEGAENLVFTVIPGSKISAPPLLDCVQIGAAA
jgi:hypothetical protein